MLTDNVTSSHHVSPHLLWALSSKHVCKVFNLSSQLTSKNSGMLDGCKLPGCHQHLRLHLIVVESSINSVCIMHLSAVLQLSARDFTLYTAAVRALYCCEEF